MPKRDGFSLIEAIKKIIRNSAFSIYTMQFNENENYENGLGSLTRRDFLKLVGIGVVLVAMPLLANGTSQSVVQGVTLNRQGSKARSRIGATKSQLRITQMRVTQHDLSTLRQGHIEKEAEFSFVEKLSNYERDFVNDIDKQLNELAGIIRSVIDGVPLTMEDKFRAFRAVKNLSDAVSEVVALSEFESRGVPENYVANHIRDDYLKNLPQYIEKHDREMNNLVHERAQFKEQLDSALEGMKRDQKNSTSNSVDKQQYNIESNSTFEATA